MGNDKNHEKIIYCLDQCTYTDGFSLLLWRRKIKIFNTNALKFYILEHYILMFLIKVLGTILMDLVDI